MLVVIQVLVEEGKAVEEAQQLQQLQQLELQIQAVAVVGRSLILRLWQWLVDQE